MKFFNLAITPKFYAMVGSILLGSGSLSTTCFAQDSGAIVHESGQRSKMLSLDQRLGYYQLPNKVAFYEVRQKDTSLFVTQLWDSKEYQLRRIDEMNFESKNEGYKVEFIKDSSGRITHAKILGRIMITKVDFDPKKIIKLSAEELERLEGTYALSGDKALKIQIQTTEKGLTIRQIWDNTVVDFTPRSKTFFLNEDGTFPLTFSFSNGKVTQVICFENDIWLKEK